MVLLDIYFYEYQWVTKSGSIYCETVFHEDNTNQILE